MSAAPREARPRRGIALLTALAVITLLTLMVAGAFAGIVLSSRTNRLSQIDARIDAATEYALYAPIADWRTWDLAALRPGETRGNVVAVPSAGGIAAWVSATRLPNGVLWVVASTRAVAADSARRHLNVVLRLRASDPVPEAPVVSRGDVRLGSGVQVDVDTAEAVRCAALPRASVVVGPGAAFDAVADSVQPVTAAVSPVASDSAVYRLGGAGWSAWAGGAGLTIVPGDLTLSTGSGSGVLLVAGRLNVSGPYTFTGLVVARDGVTASGGLSVTGALLSFAAPGSPTAMDLRDTRVRYAPCAVRYALESAFPPAMADGRSWADLF